MRITMMDARRAAAASRQTCDGDGYGYQILVWADGENTMAISDNDVIARGAADGGWEWPILRIRSPQQNGEAVLALLSA